MILQRLATSIRKQDWFTVLIETLIVVLGVFLGIQLGNLNQARVERNSEQVLLLRLQEETRSLLDTQKEELAVHSPRLGLATDANSVMFSLVPSRPLTDDECWALLVSHWIPSPTEELSSLDDLISSGRFDLISNPSVKSALRDYAVVQERSRVARAEAVNELFRLHTRYPDAIWLEVGGAEDADYVRPNVSPDDEGLVWRYNCDIDQIRGNKGLLSEYSDNIARLESYLQRYEDRIAVLTVLDAELTKELGTSGSPRESEVAP
ncbi:hypothetical protein [Henriciella litoralis]|uniref:hypothetical protein n=1 Tax=Henriciella litoralis TaxID=568102 RepID=UPI0009FFF06A|nr:hypothetical protein [Henriciella litoralis]